MQPCQNPKCDNEKTTPVLIKGNVVFYICEKCGKQFSYCDQGFATQQEIEQLQEEYCVEVMATGRYEPMELRKVLSNIGFEPKNHGHSIKLYHPMRHRFGPGSKRVEIRKTAG